MEDNKVGLLDDISEYSFYNSLKHVECEVRSTFDNDELNWKTFNSGLKVVDCHLCDHILYLRAKISTAIGIKTLNSVEKDLIQNDKMRNNLLTIYDKSE